MSEVHVDPITLDLHFQRLQYATGFDVRALIAERDRYRKALEAVTWTHCTCGESTECASAIADLALTP